MEFKREPRMNQMAMQQAQQPASLGPASVKYLEELKTEVSQVDASTLSHASRLLNDEVKRVEQGNAKKQVPTVEAHHSRPQGVALKVKIPVRDFPKFNFVGKLLGPKGMSLKRLQEETGTKMSILGKGSMRDKNKEEEMKKEGGKYAHLNEDLHLLIEVYSEVSDCYARLSHAVSEVQKFLTPDYNDEISQQQMEEMMFLNGEKPTPGGVGGGRGRGRGGPRGAGRGGILGGGPTGGGGGRAAPPGRSVSHRGAPRGGSTIGAARGAPRGAPSGRGRPAPPPAQNTSYNDYSNQGYEEYSDPYARETFDASYGGGDTQYFDYGHGSSAAGGYEEAGYEGEYDQAGYGETGGGWGSTNTQMKAPSTRGSRGQFRQHPYGGGRGGGAY
ncbi:KH domain-containing, RNA-binding, signal transduction-associated protein 2-like isoform X1 [Pecten maximus]|uniref:KH domain-containing, RNA-binding, signal transduction-associated protein 2-like isoform X1 n=1 Tax=Pecten maximus TaxID=6579 RepID=UPI0014582D52|nr:KH domain-containing, RNA-binding, signal transduction-associated protein 2-like isoform X1 [Pecten maximus]XP_033738653.1 KH domain-containing, RNA-binding, signal transduction-associated protein 2-like isoform X1 [Pecten maximus]